MKEKENRQQVIGQGMEYAQSEWDWKFGPLRGGKDTVMLGCHQHKLLTRRTLFEIVMFQRRLFCVMKHTFHGSDEERDLHDHPWPFVTYLNGKAGYWEEMPFALGKTCTRFRPPGSLLFRGARFKHAVRFDSDYVDGECTSIVITGPKIRTWGFWINQGITWTPWHDYGKSKICE